MRRPWQAWHHDVASGLPGSTVSRAVWGAGAIPAIIFGIALGGPLGAFAGLVVWGLTCLLAARVDRLRHRRPSRTTTAEVELFEQLRMTACRSCGADTLLEICLDCTEGPSHQRPRRHEDVPRDEPEDPAA